MDLLQTKLALLPTDPGCYIMKNNKGMIIYVGKAKNLKSRVRSYFTGKHTIKTAHLVAEIADFEYIVTTSNTEALLLEINLIKQHLPKYNILLKDDKSYPYLKLTNEAHPRLLLTRRVRKDGGHYFGPYPSSKDAVEVKKLLDRLYPLRKCETMPKKTCLYYHIGQCLAPCVFSVKEEEKQTAEKVIRFLKGDYSVVKKQLEATMQEAAAQLDFEKATEYRDQLQAIEQLLIDQTIYTNDFLDRDVFAYAVMDGWISIHVLFVRNGKLIERKRAIYPLYRSAEEEMESYIGQFYLHHIKPKELILPNKLTNDVIEQAVGIRVHTPQRGKKKALLAMAEKNAKLALDETIHLHITKEQKEQKALAEIATLLQIPTPKHIEAFDNSNISGVSPVSAMIVFTDGKPDKKKYRKYKIKTVTGPDDYASMKEVMNRRYTKVLAEKEALPDLIIIDGGIGHLKAAKEVLETLSIEVPIASLAKDNKHQTAVLLSGATMLPVDLSPKSEGFYLLTRIQEEVHRFAITFFRTTHQKTMTKSVLDTVQGIGAKRKKQLYAHFQTIDKMKQASIEDFQTAGMPKQVATTLYNTFQKGEG